MSTPAVAGVVFAADIARLAAFYRGVAGMRETHADDRHVVLEIPGFQLTVHALSGSEGHPQYAYPTREDTYIKLCFPVTSLAEARTLASSLGGELWPVDREWEARGFRACDGRDPEGNVFQLRQRS